MDCDPVRSKRLATDEFRQLIKEGFGVMRINPIHSPDLPITYRMRRLSKIKREESPKPPQQPILPEKPVDITTGPPDLRTELDDNSDDGRSLSCQTLEAGSPDPAILPDEGGVVGPRILFQNGMDANQQLPASGAQS